MSKLAIVTAEKPVTVTLVMNSEKRHSVRYDAVGDDPALTSAYIMKHSLPKPYPQTVKVTLAFE